MFSNIEHYHQMVQIGNQLYVNVSCADDGFVADVISVVGLIVTCPIIYYDHG